LVTCEKQEKKREQLGFDALFRLIDIQTKLNIPIFSIQLETKQEKDIKFLDLIISELLHNKKIQENKIKVMFIGKWFDLPLAMIENIKKIMEETKEYDNFFLNLLVKYDGKDEITTVIKLLTIKAMNKQIETDKINQDLIKELLFTSYFVPPELIIQGGYRYSGILLWDSPEAVIYFTKSNHWITIGRKDIDAALSQYKKVIAEETRLKDKCDLTTSN
jgi:undecaprenyl diphosphate synthase